MSRSRVKASVGAVARLSSRSPPSFIRRTWRDMWTLAAGVMVVVGCMFVVRGGNDTVDGRASLRGSDVSLVTPQQSSTSFDASSGIRSVWRLRAHFVHMRLAPGQSPHSGSLSISTTREVITCL